MNIFYFDECPVKSAIAQPDKMLVKMPLETAQMLSTAHRVLDGDSYADSVGLYKQAFVNHPCTIWARQCVINYSWLYRHFIALGEEYTYRYGKEHETARKLRGNLTRLPTNIKPDFFAEPPQCMPFTCKMLNAIDAYKRYYIREKASFAKWTNRQIPEWFNNASI